RPRGRSLRARGHQPRRRARAAPAGALPRRARRARHREAHCDDRRCGGARARPAGRRGRRSPHPPDPRGRTPPGSPRPRGPGTHRRRVGRAGSPPGEAREGAHEAMKNPDMMEALRALAAERGISEEDLLLALANALVTAYKRLPNAAEEAEVEIDPDSGDIRV